MTAYGVIDVGTNSVKFHIGERHDDGTWSTLVDRAEVSRLGEGIAETGDIAPEAIARTVDAVCGMAEEARQHDVAGLVAVGTMGMRTAGNSDVFIASVRERCGIGIEVLPGTEEGRLAYLATQAGLGLGRGRVVVFDTGGGSTQFTFGHGGAVDEQYSLDVGAVRLAAKYGLDGPVTREKLEDALAAIAGELSRLDDEPPPGRLVGMGGAITNMTAVMLGLEHYEPDAVQGAVLDRAEVDRQIELFRRHDAVGRRQIVGLQPKRADVILAGACVVRTVMGKLRQDALTVSDRGLRHGVLARALRLTRQRVGPDRTRGTMARGARIQRWMPGVRAVRTYERRWLRKDLVAGVVLAAILVPQGMAYAELAGLPAVTGLYTTIACLIGYAVFGPSRILVLGPDSSVSPLIFAAIVPLMVVDDPASAIALAGMMAVFVGLIEIGMGLGKLGFVADLLSKEVQVGYMNGLAVTIIVGQLPKLFGFSTDADTFIDDVQAFFAGLDQTDATTLAVGAGAAWRSCSCSRCSPAACRRCWWRSSAPPSCRRCSGSPSRA